MQKKKSNLFNPQADRAVMATVSAKSVEHTQHAPACKTFTTQPVTLRSDQCRQNFERGEMF